MKRCFCEDWCEAQDSIGQPIQLEAPDVEGLGYWEVDARYCPWCGSKLTNTKKKWAVVNAPSASVAKRLNKQMPGEDVPPEKWRE